VALLATSLVLDALFNLLLGVGLVIMGLALWRRQDAWPRLALFTAAAGLASIPVSLQVISDTAARLLTVAGPLWLVMVGITSVLLWRGRL
jgi:hypothetical protein